MIAMMTPTVAPVLLTLTALNRRRRSQQRPFLPTSFFLFGYLTVWTGFSLVATLLQWAFQATALLSPAWATPNALLAGSLLLAAGLFQGTSLKQTCLVQCRSPLDFFLRHWREGLGGAFSMGLRHGAYCLGCCWFLMCLLFVVGVMNIIWIALLTLFVLMEKTLPLPRFWAGFAGLGLVTWGSWVLGHAINSNI